MSTVKYHSLTDPIVFTAARLEAIANRFVFEPLGLTLASARLIRLLVEIGPMAPGDLLRLAGGTKGNISQRLGFLEREGYIRRAAHTNSHDHRKVAVAVTPKGQRQFELIFTRFEKARTCLEQSFTEEEKCHYFAFFEKLNRLLDESEKEFPKIFKQLSKIS